jgi:hypothetical protein
MASTWVESLGHGFEHALTLLDAAVRDCPDELWGRPMWEVPALGEDHQFLGPDWKPVTDPARVRVLGERWVQRRSTPWSVAWHALETLDYDLTGEFGPWAPPPPFAGYPHWRDLPILQAAWSRSEIAGYIDYCRERAARTLAQMTGEKASRPLPPAHRYSGQPHARILIGAMSHTTEHAAQIGQFITSAGRAADA